MRRLLRRAPAPQLAVHLQWRHPGPAPAALRGYNIYRAIYGGHTPIRTEAVNGIPQPTMDAGVIDVRPPPPYNHRYAITSVSRDGIESLFSHVRILDWNTKANLFDAGYIPL